MLRLYNLLIQQAKEKKSYNNGNLLKLVDNLGDKLISTEISTGTLSLPLASVPES